MKKLICALLASAMLVGSVGVVGFADEDTNAETVVTTSAEATEKPADAEFYAVAQQMYQQANPQGDPNAQQGAPNDDGVYEADYREVDNDDNNQQ